MSSVSNNFRSQVSGLGVSGVRCQIAAYTRCRVSAVDTVKSFVSQSVYLVDTVKSFVSQSVYLVDMVKSFVSYSVYLVDTVKSFVSQSVYFATLECELRRAVASK